MALEHELDEIFSTLHGFVLEASNDCWRVVLQQSGVKIADGHGRSSSVLVELREKRGEPDVLRTTVDIPSVAASSAARSLLARSRGLDFNDFFLREDFLEDVAGAEREGDPDGLGAVCVFRSLANYFGWTVRTPMLHASRRLPDGTAMSLKVPVEREGDGWTARRRMESIFAVGSQHVGPTADGCRLTAVGVLGRLPSDLAPGLPREALAQLWHHSAAKRVLRMARLAAGEALAPEQRREEEAARPLPPMHQLFFDLLGIAGPGAALAEAATAEEAEGEPLTGPVVRHVAPDLLHEPDVASRLEEAMQACADLSLRLERMAPPPPAPGPPPPPAPAAPAPLPERGEEGAEGEGEAGEEEGGGGPPERPPASPWGLELRPLAEAPLDPRAVPGSGPRGRPRRWRGGGSMLEFIEERRGSYGHLPAHELAARLADDWKALEARDRGSYQRMARKRRRWERAVSAPPRPLRPLVPKEAPPAPPPPGPAPPQHRVAWYPCLVPVAVPCGPGDAGEAPGPPGPLEHHFGRIYPPPDGPPAAYGAPALLGGPPPSLANFPQVCRPPRSPC